MLVQCSFSVSLRDSHLYSLTLCRGRDGGVAASRAQALEEARLLGTRICPRIDEVPMIEPLICKKISHERLTVCYVVLIHSEIFPILIILMVECFWSTAATKSSH